MRASFVERLRTSADLAPDYLRGALRAGPASLARGLKALRTDIGEAGREEMRRLVGKASTGERTGERKGERKGETRRTLESLLLGAAVFGAYETTRYRPLGGVEQALENAVRIRHLQRALGLPDEARLQGWALARPGLVISANWFYLLGHFPVTGATLAWAYLRREDHRRFIPALLLTTTAAFAVMLTVPLAPPRLLEGHGFVDTMEVYGPYIYASPQVAATANQYAAMPSLHVGWALWVAWTLVRTSDSRWRWLALAHPPLTFAGVVFTANHFWLDGVVGAALLAASVRVAGNWESPS